MSYSRIMSRSTISSGQLPTLPPASIIGILNVSKWPIPKRRTLSSMFVALRLSMGLGSVAPALQLPRLGSNISVESIFDPSLRDTPPPLTRNICNKTEDSLTNNYRAWLRLNAFQVLACLLACLLTCLLACLPICLLPCPLTCFLVCLP